MVSPPSRCRRTSSGLESGIITSSICRPDDGFDLKAERPSPHGVEADQRIAKLRANAVA
jgi:hypothetical protein